MASSHFSVSNCMIVNIHRLDVCLCKCSYRIPQVLWVPHMISVGMKRIF
jgi:hypothetical protein